MKPLNSKVFPMTSAIDESGQLVVGGCNVMNLANEYGTPLYVLDNETIVARCQEYRHEFESRYQNTKVLYASKAVINLGLANLIDSQGLGFDVVSGGELAVLKAAGVPMETVYFHGNNKSYEELNDALDVSIGRIVVDSFHEIELLNQLAGEKGLVQDILLRVSPSIDPHTHVYTTTGVLDSKFGFSLETGHAKLAVQQCLKASNLRLLGLHFHLGSPIFETEPYAKAIEVVLEFASEMREYGLELKEFSPGGGFAIAYLDHDNPPPVKDFAEVIVGAVKERCGVLNMDLPELTIEPGRSIVGPAGVALYTVGAIKEIPGVRSYVSVDGGMGDNIRPALYQAQYEVVAANKMFEKNVAPVTIAGKFCESGDILVRDAQMPSLVQVDVIEIPASGAYCPSMASNYNLAPRPPIVIVENGSSRVLRRRETYEDLMALDSR